MDTGSETAGGEDGCPQGLDLCDGECVDLKWDPFHCGECGNTCFAQESCVDGSCEVGKLTFVTSSPYAGNLGGLTGADAVCMFHAEQAGMEGEFKAWLADDTGSPADRMTHFAGGYRLPSGAVVADSWDDLVDGSLQHPIDETELSGSLPGELICMGNEVWSNVAPGGTAFDANHCLNWTAVDEGVSNVGRFTETDASWTHDVGCMMVVCSAPLSFYCVQQ